MTMLPLEMTKGDLFYHEIAFTDASGNPIDISAWGMQVDFKAEISDTVPLFSLTFTNTGLARLTDTGAVSLQFAAAALDKFDINLRPRNGELVPWRWLYGDIKLTPPAGTNYVQGDGARTDIILKVKAGITA